MIRTPRILSFIFFSLFLSTSFAQSSSNFSIEVSANSNIVAQDRFSYFIINTDSEIQYIQDARMRVLPTVSIFYSITDRASLLTGLHLYDFGHNSERLEIPSFIRTDHRYRAYFLSVPIGVDYKFINRRFKSSIFTALLTDIYLTEKSNEPEFEQVDSFDWNRINFGAQLGLGFEYSIANSMNLSLRPYFSAPLHDYVDKNGPANVQDIKPFRLGVTFGVTYRL